MVGVFTALRLVSVNMFLASPIGLQISVCPVSLVNPACEACPVRLVHNGNTCYCPPCTVVAILFKPNFKHVLDQTDSFAHLYSQISLALATQLMHVTPLLQYIAADTICLPHVRMRERPMQHNSDIMSRPHRIPNAAHGTVARLCVGHPRPSQIRSRTPCVLL